MIGKGGGEKNTDDGEFLCLSSVSHEKEEKGRVLERRRRRCKGSDEDRTVASGTKASRHVGTDTLKLASVVMKYREERGHVDAAAQDVVLCREGRTCE